MLVYHPAFDPYHSAFRIMRILGVIQKRPIEIEGIRIADFYMLFPCLIFGIRLPKKLVKWRKLFLGLENPYNFSGNPKLVFLRMKSFQLMALRAMASRDIIDKQNFEADVVVRTELSYPASLHKLIKKANEQDSDVMCFLTELLDEIPIFGSNGIKARTGLLEYRYDSI